MHLEEGTIIAEHYRLVKHLGDGSFGNVWLAHNLLADIDVAIKFYGTLDKKGLEEFRNEFKIAYKLHHPNLLNISHFDVTDNCPYLVMPYCENGSLSSKIGQMPETEIWKFLLDVSCGLAFLHSQQPPVVHQDIKPANILITSDGRYVISDFGISRSLRTQMSQTANKPNISGTIAYMGPERFSEKPMIVLTSDVWALGMTAYELMTGNVLWEGMGGCVQLNGARIPDDIEGFSPELIRLVKTCLAPETWNRPTAMQIHEYASERLNQHTTVNSLQSIANNQQPIANSHQPIVNSQQPIPQPLYTSELEDSGTPITSSRDDSLRKMDKPRQNDFASEQSSTFHLPSSIFNKRNLLIAAAVIAALILLVVGGKVVSAINEEQQFVSCRTLEDYQQFINDYPSSSYVETARRRISDLTPKVEPVRHAIYDSSPTTRETSPSASTSSRETSLSTSTSSRETSPSASISSREFSSDNDRPVVVEPVSPPKEKPAPARPRNHNNKPKRSADDAAFYSCHSASDYHNYIRRYPNGKHRQAAERALTRLVNR